MALLPAYYTTTRLSGKSKAKKKPGWKERQAKHDAIHSDTSAPLLTRLLLSVLHTDRTHHPFLPRSKDAVAPSVLLSSPSSPLSLSRAPSPLPR